MLALSFGCGKKITETETNKSNHITEPQALSEDLTLEVDENVSPVTIFAIPENAMFRIPTELIAKDGKASGKKIVIFYNATGDNDYKFQCSYSSIDHDTTLAFEKCESNNGNKLISFRENIEDMWFPMNKGAQVKLVLTNPTGTGMKIESIYLVDWK